MNQFSTPQAQTGLIVKQNTLVRHVYTWMALGLMLTAIMSLVTVSFPALLNAVFSNKLVYYGLMIGELALVFTLSGAINRLSESTATLLFLGYSLLNGVTLSVIFLVYSASSITTTFAVTAATFGAMSVYGAVTKNDLTSWGNFLFMGLIGIVIASIVNIFMKSNAVSWVVSAIGVIVFTGLTAYDTWKIKALAATGETGRKPAILGALTLYLDFINLFLMLLRFLGGKRD